MTDKTKLDDSMTVKAHWRRWPILFLYAAYAALYSIQVSITTIGKTSHYLYMVIDTCLHSPLVKIRLAIAIRGYT